MLRIATPWPILLAALAAAALAPADDDAPPAAAPPAGVEEARARARLLHEAFHGALQVVHRDYFREDEGLPLPSHSLEDVFVEMSREHGVSLRWVAVDAQAMNVDHAPRDDFEKAAAKALAAGEPEFDAMEDGVYRHAGRVRLSSSCLKCHVPNRTSTRDRSAALVITIPVKGD